MSPRRGRCARSLTRAQLGLAAPLVEVEASAEGDNAVIRVRDNGPGVKPADRARIFEPFYTTTPGGTGLGLAVVRSVALAHGGGVRLEDSAEGACFALSLPAHRSDP